MNNPKPLAPHEDAEVETKREPRRANQPYSAELDDREFEHAHNEHRPVHPQTKATRPETPRR